MTWTPERIITLRKLWTLGESASAIAASLGGISKNAVIGKARRLRLPAHVGTTRQYARKLAPSRCRPPRKTRPNNPALSRSPATALPDLAPAPSKTPTYKDIQPHQCRWPEGDPKTTEFHFCGRPVHPQKPYCPHHLHRAYQNPQAAFYPKNQAPSD